MSGAIWLKWEVLFLPIKRAREVQACVRPALSLALGERNVLYITDTSYFFILRESGKKVDIRQLLSLLILSHPHSHSLSNF